MMTTSIMASYPPSIDATVMASPDVRRAIEATARRAALAAMARTLTALHQTRLEGAGVALSGSHAYPRIAPLFSTERPYTATPEGEGDAPREGSGRLCVVSEQESGARNA